MRIAHTALWTCDTDEAVAFWVKYFGATVGDAYSSQRRPGFVSRFLQLPDSVDQIELMTGPWIQQEAYQERPGWDHIAISLGDTSAVDALAEQCRADGCLKLGPRMTGDGFYEAVITMPDGTPIEITD